MRDCRHGVVRLAILAAVASALVAVATVAWIVSHGRREYAAPLRPAPEDDVQPFDPRTAATGLAAG